LQWYPYNKENLGARSLAFKQPFSFQELIHASAGNCIQQREYPPQLGQSCFRDRVQARLFYLIHGAPGGTQTPKPTGSKPAENKAAKAIATKNLPSDRGIPMPVDFFIACKRRSAKKVRAAWQVLPNVVRHS